MSIKEDILDSWIMVELLSEGDIKTKDKDLLKLDKLKGKDYYSFFRNELSKELKKAKYKSKIGIGIYFDIFNFEDVIGFLREQYHLDPPVEKPKYGSKFKLALYFDKDLRFIKDLTFFTVSGFIQNTKQIPDLNDFREYEEVKTAEIENYFDWENICVDNRKSDDKFKDDSGYDYIDSIMNEIEDSLDAVAEAGTEYVPGSKSDDEPDDSIESETEDDTEDETGDDTEDDTEDEAGDDTEDETGDDTEDETGDDTEDETGDDTEDDTEDETGDDTEDDTEDETGDDTEDETGNEAEKKIEDSLDGEPGEPTKNKAGKITEIHEKDNNENISDIDPRKFNEAIDKVFNLLGFGAGLSNSGIKIIDNIEADAVNLHSFFIDDLEKAKAISTENLDKYLLGGEIRRFNLDSKKESVNFNPTLLSEILKPENYPLGRFPGKTEFSPYFMQQIAVNLSIGLDTSQMRSVNGPPGTGKTTLLKDIFAELIVKQAYDICNLPDRVITGTEDTVYFEKASIGLLPENITENSIIVASSNNGAVKNIVDELPLKKDVAGSLIDEIKKIDYFYEISNSTVEVKRIYDKENKENKEIIELKPNKENDKFWGLFSLEGGRSENMKNILSCMKAIIKYFDSDDYEPDFGAYDRFIQKYNEMLDLRSRIQSISEEQPRFAEERSIFEAKNTVFSNEKKERENKIQLANEEKAVKERQYQNEILRNESRLDKIQKQLEERKENLENYRCLLQELKSEKPYTTAKQEIKEQYDQNLCDAQTGLTQVTKNIQALEDEKRDLEKLIDDSEEAIRKENEMLDEMEKELASWEKNVSYELNQLSEKVEKNKAKAEGVQPINLDQPYNELQLSNPWFNEQYRIAQSKLFIAALEVRKMFLYENIKNIKAAINIWNHQTQYLEKKTVILAAWNWINMCIPVISSTFASFGRMFKYIGPDKLGHLFIDEAGQALPQAGVGAIFRSRHVMVVGDPAQIKPVLTLEKNVLAMLGKHFNVSEKYLSESASTQTLVDAVSQYGYYREKDCSEESWIGIPLWVHRRCRYPMFTIANKISYNDMMVHAEPKNGKTGWYNIKGRAQDKYVKEQGEFLKEMLKKMIAGNPDIINKSEKDIVYVITPFTNVAFRLARELNDIGFSFTRYEKGKPTNVGTIHTFQGKEAKIVFLVLGADENCKGAAAWAVEEPNMINVAATRAKEEFYIIGDRNMYLGLKSDVIKDTYKVMQQYEKINPELVFDEKKYKTVKYIGNQKNKSFHCLNCKYAPKDPEKRVEFSSREEALKEKYEPCNTCKA